MIEVLHAGLCDLVMDQGRPGWGALGVPTCGAADIAALVAADMAKLAQLRPGDTVRFATVELEQARLLATGQWEIGELT